MMGLEQDFCVDWHMDIMTISNVADKFWPNLLRFWSLHDLIMKVKISTLSQK